MRATGFEFASLEEVERVIAISNDIISGRNPLGDPKDYRKRKLLALLERNRRARKNRN